MYIEYSVSVSVFGPRPDFFPSRYLVLAHVLDVGYGSTCLKKVTLEVVSVHLFRNLIRGKGKLKNVLGFFDGTQCFYHISWARK